MEERICCPIPISAVATTTTNASIIGKVHYIRHQLHSLSGNHISADYMRHYKKATYMQIKMCQILLT